MYYKNGNKTDQGNHWEMCLFCINSPTNFSHQFILMFVCLVYMHSVHFAIVNIDLNNHVNVEMITTGFKKSLLVIIVISNKESYTNVLCCHLVIKLFTTCKHCKLTPH